MADPLHLLRQAEAALDELDQMTEGDAAEHATQVSERLRRTKPGLLTALLKMAAELGLVVQRRNYFYFDPSCMYPAPHIRRARLSKYSSDIPDVVANKRLFPIVMEEVLATLEQHIGTSLAYLERFSTLLEQSERIDELRESHGVPLDLPLKEFFIVGDPIESRLYNQLKRSGHERIGSVLEVDIDTLLSYRNFGVVSLVVFYRKLASRGWLKYAKSWPPDRESRFYRTVKRVLEKHWPEWRESLEGGREE